MISKAETYARDYKTVLDTRPAPFSGLPPYDHQSRKVTASVSDTGQVWLSMDGKTLDGDVFYQLCLWGLETFGPVPGPPTIPALARKIFETMEAAAEKHLPGQSTVEEWDELSAQARLVYTETAAVLLSEFFHGH